jgi:hypothetical protein
MTSCCSSDGLLVLLLLLQFVSSSSSFLVFHFSFFLKKLPALIALQVFWLHPEGTGIGLGSHRLSVKGSLDQNGSIDDDRNGRRLPKLRKLRDVYCLIQDDIWLFLN